MNNNVLKGLLKDNKQALRALHSTFNFDFCKPYTALYIEGNFTINQIFKKLDTSTKNRVVVLTQDPENYCFKDEYQAAIIYSSGSFDIEFSKRIPYYSGPCRIDDYTRKSDFETTRKHKNIRSYVIAQPVEYLTPDKKHETDYTQRFKYIAPDYKNQERTYYAGGNNGFYISNITLQETTSNGYKFEYKPAIYGRNNEPRTISEIIDKSGYIIYKKRDELKRRARALKADREKAAYIQTNNQDKLKELETLIADKKRHIAEALNTATTYEEVKEINKKLDFFHGLSDAMFQLKLMKAREAEKKYSSIESFNNDYNHVINVLNNL